MQKTIYEDKKYSMQDVGTLYIGSKYTLNEILDAEDITFKFRLIVERYILPEADLEDTLETHLYYLEPKSFVVKIYKQLKARVKVNMLEDKKGLLGGSKMQYVTKLLKIEELAAMSLEEKKEKGVVVQELSMSKLALMSF
ncbi:MAG: hypothetical protein J6A94_11470 [Lachnospiraceae bacterium]|nr:hypothetical protein [Lachnospiraceae bacterium]